MRLSWLPWKFVIRKLARAHGFLDPITIWSYFQKFAQPSEVAGPIELIRDSAVFHARGLINCRAIPQNQDWIWPWWINQQFNPQNPTFIPRAFSLTYVNLTHRNWTAVGQPDCPYYPIIDPAGLITPHLDGWSLDVFLIDDKNRLYAPSRQKTAPKQTITCREKLEVMTDHEFFGDTIRVTTKLLAERNRPFCKIRIQAKEQNAQKIIVSLRPYNPEGISFVHTIENTSDSKRWRVNDMDTIEFDPPAEETYFSEYQHGDVINRILEKRTCEKNQVECDVGLASGGAVFALNGEREINVTVALDSRKPDIKYTSLDPGREVWRQSLADYCRIELPDARKQFLYDTAIRSVLMHTNSQEVYPGPFTYKKFWFRDAAFILYALLCANLPKRVKTILDTYPHKQKLNGYFQSQQGEWDSNGQSIWILGQYLKLTGERPDKKWMQAVEKAACWILHKCTDPDGHENHAGLLPAGFSAEHFGPNDFYYWDDYWALAGLQTANELCRKYGRQKEAKKFEQGAHRLHTAIEKSVAKAQQRLHVQSIPVSPNRRMDSAAIGSLACRYPVQIYDAADKRLMATADYLYHHHCFHDGFLLNVSHSGINAYLTLHLAQVFMQAGDNRFILLEDELTRLASATGQWPEAIHPQTRAGCMGDGQHIWAAAEWITFLRNSLVFEDFRTGQLVLGLGVHPEWAQPGKKIEIGPAATIWGQVNATFLFENHMANIKLKSQWRTPPSEIRVAIPGFCEKTFPSQSTDITVHKKG